MKNYFSKSGLSTFAFAGLLLIQACDKDDPQPVNEEEIITTVVVTLTPVGGGASIELKYFDEDGDTGSANPEITVSGALAANTSYDASVTLLNETESPAEDITEEIQNESDDHLFCYSTSAAAIAIAYADEDPNGLPIGLLTVWNTGQPSTGIIKVALRHQPGTKTGDCPGDGETDIEITFPISIE